MEKYKNELKVGNFVSDNYGGICQIINIDTKKNTVEIKKRGQTITGIVNINDIKAILINHEWMILFGFEESFISGFNHCYCNKKYDRWVIQEMRNAFVFMLNDDISNKLHVLVGFNCVHQLQNVFEQLTTFQLNIE